VRVLKALRSASLSRARTILAPSEYLAEIAGGWGLGAGHVHVLTNPAPPPRDVEAEELPAGTFVFVGRLTRAKDLGTAIAAVAQVPAARLVLVGDGPDRAELERLAAGSDAAGRIEFRGSLPRDEALRVVAGAEAGLLSSAWENLPHSAVEALSVGVPVVATSVGGVPEVVHDEENGLLVRPGRPDELAVALRRMLEEPGLRDRLAAAAKPSVEAISSDAIYGRLEALLLEAARE
jgi:glycosyltransferase involved in cell wall biosynthesis